MAVETHEIRIKTRGNSEVLNLTDEVLQCVGGGKIRSGTATAFVIGSTAGITTTEFEPGLVNHDLAAAHALQNLIGKIQYLTVSPCLDLYFVRFNRHNPTFHYRVA